MQIDKEKICTKCDLVVNVTIRWRSVSMDIGCVGENNNTKAFYKPVPFQ